jgi:hypothetical protein
MDDERLHDDDSEIIPDPGGWVAYALLIAGVIIIGLYAVALLLSI